MRIVNKDIETRQIALENVEVRSEENGNMIIEGYVATFNSKSKYMGFYEIIDPHAFDNTLADKHNIFMLYNHDWDKPLGDLETNTLRLEVDGTGLRFSLTIDDSVSYAKDVYQLAKKNLIKGCSFGFSCGRDTWAINDNMEDIRTLLDITLYECTLTATPAYNATSASCRSYEQHINELEKRSKEKLKLQLELI